jgi:prevent-host-death family protein
MSTKAIPAKTKAVNVNLQDAKTHLSRYLDDVEKGGVVVLCRHNKPVAEIRRIEPIDTSQPEFGIYDGVGVSQSFFEPLPDDLLREFGGV